MMTHPIQYFRLLTRYHRLAGPAELVRLLGAILGSKLCHQKNPESQRAMQRWAFFKLVAGEKNVRFISTRKNEFVLSYSGKPDAKDAVQVALRMPDMDSSDPRVFEQVFLRNEYAHVLDWFAGFRTGGDIQTILDVGANIGCSALFFTTRHPEAAIFCLEPESSNFARLRLNLDLNHNSRIRCCQAALWTHPGRLDCRRDFRDGKEWGARFVEPQEQEDKVVQGVPAIDIKGLMQQSGFSQVDFFKMDIEGGEAALFRDPCFLEFLASKVERMAVEVHEEFIKVEEVTQIFSSHGFKTHSIGEFVCAVKAQADQSC